MDDLLGQIRERVEVKERVLVTTLTKRMAEDLTDFPARAGVRVRYLHSDIDTVERVEIIRDLRLGEFDVLVGSTSYGKVWICRKCHWWRFWMPTRKGFCVRIVR